MNLQLVREQYNTARKKIDALRRIQIYGQRDRAFIESVQRFASITEKQEDYINDIFAKYERLIARQEGGAE